MDYRVACKNNIYPVTRVFARSHTPSPHQGVIAPVQPGNIFLYLTVHLGWKRVLSAQHWMTVQTAFAKTLIVFPPYYLDLATLPHSRINNRNQEQLQGKEVLIF
jgi:hypothetical protein